MLPLIPLALSLLPELARLIGGNSGGQVASAAVAAVQAVAGTDDPTAAAAKVASDPAVAADLRVKLAAILADQAELASRLADTANARGQAQA